MQHGIVGRQAPALRVPQWIGPDGQAIDGDAFSHDFLAADGVKLIYCFQAWCPGCHRSGFPTVQTLVEHYRDEPRFTACVVQTVFEGHDQNPPSALSAMQQRYALPLSFGHDDAFPRPNTMHDYRTGGTPWMILIGADNSVLYNDFHVPATHAQRLFDRSLAGAGAPAPVAHETLHVPSRRQFTVQLDDSHLGTLHYSLVPGRKGVIAIEHTEVPLALRGKGFGSVLMEHAMEEIERMGWRVIPHCGFAAHYLARNRHWEPVVAD